MRAALFGLALFASIPASLAVAQVTEFRAQPGVLQVQRPNLLDGVWRVGALGDLTLNTRADEVLEGQLDGRACHGQYRGNAFSILCPAEGRGPYLISGVAFEEPPVATRSRSQARVFAQPARMTGQIHMTYLTADGHTEQITSLSATRQ